MADKGKGKGRGKGSKKKSSPRTNKGNEGRSAGSAKGSKARKSKGRPAKKKTPATEPAAAKAEEKPAEAPATEKPVAEKPADTPAADKPAADTPVAAEKADASEPAADTPVADKPDEDTPVADKPDEDTSAGTPDAGASAEEQPEAEAPRGATGPATYLLTGVPGFIGARLLEALLEEADSRFLLLVEGRMRGAAEELRARLGESERVELFEGDITLPDCGLDKDSLATILERTEVVVHLAAIYDLTVTEALARRVNVDGTENILGLARRMGRLRRFVHFSTCYVSGRRTGLIFEDDLDRGQGFKNHYESTKFLSEVAVQQAGSELPITVIRPAIVIGDSVTGETQKFDGPYIGFRALAMGMLLVTPGKLDVPFNLVPVDFVIDATCALIRDPGTLGKTFALADPNPLTGRDVLELTADHLDVPRPFAPVPSMLFKKLLEVEQVASFVGLPREFLEYSNHLAIYDCRNTLEALEGTGIACPPLRSYLDVIIDYWRDRVDLPYRFPAIVRTGLRNLGLG